MMVEDEAGNRLNHEQLWKVCSAHIALCSIRVDDDLAHEFYGKVFSISNMIIDSLFGQQK